VASLPGGHPPLQRRDRPLLALEAALEAAAARGEAMTV
jgi:hypothetical protein